MLSFKGGQMGWNRPSEERVATTDSQHRDGVYRHVAVISGVAVVLGVVVVAWWFLPKSENENERNPPPSHAKQRIKEVSPAVAPKASEPKHIRELSPEENRLQKITEIEKLWAGREMPPGLKTYVYYLKNPPKRTYGGDDRFGYLKHFSEKSLASFLMVEPGTYFIQCPEFGEEFDSDFVSSMRDEIQIDPKDPEDVNEMKQAIIDFKKEIADVCRNEGKLPSQILSEHAMSLFELGKYQSDMQAQLDEIYNSPKYTDADVKDFCTAANMLLKENGLQPLPYPDLTERTLELQYNLRHAEEDAANERMDNE